MKKPSKILIRQIRNSIILVSIMWYVCTQAIFILYPNLFAKSRVSENITWEIEPRPHRNDTLITFDLKYDIWLNNPFPLFTPHTSGCHAVPSGSALFENNSLPEVELYKNFPCILTVIPGIDFPGSWNFQTSVFGSVDGLNSTELPNGLYTFWVDFDLNGDNIISYKTYMNVTDDGIEMYSDEVPLFWGEILSSTGIMVVCIVMVTYLQKFKSEKKKSEKIVKTKSLLKRILIAAINGIIGMVLGIIVLEIMYYGSFLGYFFVLLNGFLIFVVNAVSALAWEKNENIQTKSKLKIFFSPVIKGVIIGAGTIVGWTYSFFSMGLGALIGALIGAVIGVVQILVIYP